MKNKGKKEQESNNISELVSKDKKNSKDDQMTVSKIDETKKQLQITWDEIFEELEEG